MTAFTHRSMQWFLDRLSRRRISLRVRFVVSLLAVVLLFGGAAVWVANWYVAHSIRASLTRKGGLLLRILALDLRERIIVNDLVSVNRLLGAVSTADEDILYLVVYDEAGAIVGHTFGGTDIPAFLATPPDDVHTQLLIDKKQGVLIRQLQTPIAGGALGRVVVGLDDSGSLDHARRLAELLSAVFLLLLVPALFVTFAVSYIITKPINEILKGFRAFVPGRPLPLVRTRFNDELRALAEGFGHMMERISVLDRQSRETQLKIIETEKLASLGVMAAGVAHEINNPVAGIEACVYRLLKTRELDPKQREYLELIASSSRHIRGVVDNLLQYARQPASRSETVELRAVVDLSRRLVEHRIERCGIRLVIDCPEEGCTVVGVKAQLVQVIVNGLMNAVDAIGGDGEIRLCLDELDGHYRIRITDDGAGVSPDVRGKVFDPFFTTKGAAGTGLGLYVSYNIVQAHSGRIELSPGVVSGAELSIHLPKEEVE